MSDRVTLEMAEARELVYTYRDIERRSTRREASAWLAKALIVTMRRFGGAEAMVRVKGYMRDIQTEEMCQ